MFLRRMRKTTLATISIGILETLGDSIFTEGKIFCPFGFTE